MVVQVSIDPQAGRDLATLSRRLKSLGDGKTIPREFRASIRRDVQPAARDAKAAARALPSHTGRRARGGESLRSEIARNVTTRIRLSGDPRIDVRIRRSALGDKGELPRNINKGFWFHPTFGHEPRVMQMGQRGWFDDVMKKAGPNVVRGLERTTDKFEARLMS